MGLGSWFKLVTMLVHLSAPVLSLSKVFLGGDGGYRNIVVKIDESVGQANCRTAVENVKVTLHAYAECFPFLKSNHLLNCFH